MVIAVAYVLTVDQRCKIQICQGVNTSCHSTLETNGHRVCSEKAVDIKRNRGCVVVNIFDTARECLQGGVWREKLGPKDNLEVLCQVGRLWLIMCQVQLECYLFSSVVVGDILYDWEEDYLERSWLIAGLQKECHEINNNHNTWN